MERHSLGLFIMSVATFACSGGEASPDNAATSGDGGSSQTTGTPGSGGNAGTDQPGTGGAPVYIDPTLASRYRSDSIQSPIAESVAKQLATIAGNGTRDDHVGTRFGDFNCKTFEEFPGKYFWGCLDPKSGTTPVWGSHADLKPTVDFLGQGKIGNFSTFTHDAVTCIESAVIKNQFDSDAAHPPNPFEYEVGHSNARFGIVMAGFIDTLYFGAQPELTWQYELEMIDRQIAIGMVPIVLSPPPLDQPGVQFPFAGRTVDTIMRGMAEARQVPFVSRFLALKGHPQGVHLDVFTGGECDFTDAALAFGMNATILHAIDAIDRAKRVMIDKAAPLDPTVGPARVGTGTATEPFEIDALPYTQLTDLARATDQAITSYASCGGADGSGTEQVYHFKATASTAVHFFGINRLKSPRTLAVHHLKDALDPKNCVQSTGPEAAYVQSEVLAPGDHYFVIDGKAGSGPAEFLFGILTCDNGDPGCK